MQPRAGARAGLGAGALPVSASPAAAAPLPACCRPGDRRRRRLAPPVVAAASSSQGGAVSYRCHKCGARPSQPMGRCPVCREWGTVERHVAAAPAPSAAGGGGGDGLAAARRAVAAAVAVGAAAAPPAAAAAARSSFSSSSADALANSTFFEFEAQGEPMVSLSPRPTAGWLAQDDDDGGQDAVPESLEQISRRRRREAAAAAAAAGGPPRSSSSFFSSSSSTRLPMPTATGAEIARVLGGGLVPGSVVLVGGDPGVGKSTLLLQAASLVARALAPAPPAAGGSAERAPPADQVGRPVLYVSAEESKEQLWMRALRLGLVPGEGDGEEGDGEGGEEGGENGNGNASTPAAGDLRLVSENRLEAVLSSIATLRPALVIVDSVQTVLLSGLGHRPGSVAQVRECATALLHAAKRLRTAVLLVGHVTKGGELAGPKALEHLVDAVIYLEGSGGGGGGQYRLLRAQKNRHGSVGEVAILRHGPRGLEAVDDYRSLFVSAAAFDGGEEEEEDEEPGEEGASCSSSSSSSAVGAGSALTVVQEGRRALVIEVQALVAGRGGEGAAMRGGGGGGSDGEDDDGEHEDEDGEDERAWRGRGGGGRWQRGGGGDSGNPSYPSSSAPLYRAAVGFASRERLPLLLEVLAKHGACAPARAARRSHVFASVAGGYRTRPGETATDAALCAALVSSALGARLPRRTAVLGEVGLAGELRPVPELEARLREAAAMGFERVVVPSANDAPVAGAAAAAAACPAPDGRRQQQQTRRRGAGGGVDGEAAAGARPRPLALDGLRKELGGGGGGGKERRGAGAGATGARGGAGAGAAGGMEIISVPTLRAALRYLFGDRLRAAGGRRRQQGQQQRRRGRGRSEEEEEAALVVSALAAASAARPAD